MMSTTPGSLRPTRDPQLPHTHPLSHRKKQRSSLGSRHRRHGVRKSLKFGEDSESSVTKERAVDCNSVNISIQNEAAQNSFLEATSHLPKFFKESKPPIPNFWNNPPPPPASPPTEGDSTTVHRRSMRLRTKSQFPIAQIPDTSPGLLIEPTSDLLLRSKTQTSACLTQCSDYGYGTSSENSLYFRPSASSSFSVSSAVSSHCQDLLPRFNKVNKTVQDSEPSSQSVGYVSDLDPDLDDSLSNLSIDDATANNKLPQPKHWDSNENIDDSEWEDLPEDAGNHLGLKDLHLKNVKVCFRTTQGVTVVMPLDGHKILRTPTRLVAAPVPFNSRYYLRKRPNRVIDIQIELLDNSNIEGHFLLEGLRVLQVSPIISIKPYEVEFVPLLPAIIQIPLMTEPSPGDEVHCLYCKSPVKDPGQDFENIPWKSVEAGKFSINNGTVYFEAFHFGMFVLIIRPKCPISSRIKEIRTRAGGKLTISDFPSMEVAFPKEATDDVLIKAEAKVYLDTEESVSEFLAKRSVKLGSSNSSAMEVDNCDDGRNYLATPILQLEPHGISFKNKPVTVTLPVPDYDEIMRVTNNTAKLVIFQSNTQLHETARWEELQVKYEISKVKFKGEFVTVVTFPVTHFSFFKGVWVALSNCLDKIGMLYYFVSIAMKCQANMEEYGGETSNTASTSKTDADGNEQQKEQFGGGSRFGLEVSVFQADKNWPQMATYKYKVGQSNSKLVKPGKVLVRLKSLYFESDVQAGEDEDMVKEEADFRGRDFEKQFICKFKPDVKIDRGPFGKVVITRFVSPKVSQPLFEFNLQKHGNEADVKPVDNQSDRWSIVALRELANNLFLTDGDNWKEFAQEVGMTKQEVKDANVKHDSDPFQKIVTHYRNRGGTAEELIGVMYRCHRTIKIKGNFSPESSRQTKSSTGSSGRGSLSSNNAHCNQFGSHDSDTSGKTTETHTSQDSGLPYGRKRPHQLSNRGSGVSMASSKKPKRKRPIEHLAGPSVRLYEGSDADEEDSDIDRVPPPSSIAKSIVSGDEESKKHDKTILNTQFLWSISESINVSSWRSIGRTLGLEEAVLIEVDHGFGKTSFRECSYQMLLEWKNRFPKKCTFGNLYNALNKEGMAAAAKKMMEVDLSSDSDNI